jgi:TPR repeat protein
LRHDRPAPAAPATVGITALPPPAQAAPTRDEIALALRAAHQSQPEVRPSATAPPPVRRLDADQLANLLKRAKGLIAIGDIASARLLLERAADAQEAGAALLLAQTWDPAVLGTPDARSITPDPAKARDWYRKAARFGSQDAQLRLSQMRD